VLLSGALRSSRPAELVRTVVIGGGLAAGLGAYAASRARRLRSE